jgi:hypothetical protein
MMVLAGLVTAGARPSPVVSDNGPLLLDCRLF